MQKTETRAGQALTDDSIRDRALARAYAILLELVDEAEPEPESSEERASSKSL
jgi:hypothetical protein